METRDQGPDRFTDKALDETVLTRRQAMALGAAAGVAATGAGALGLPSIAAAATPPNYPPPLKTVPPPPVPLFSDQTLTFQTLFALGNISAASGEYGEIVTVVKRVQDRGESYLAFYEEFLAEARAVNRYADNAARRGRRITARNAYLRAASYYGQSLYFALILASDSEITAMASGGAVPSSARARERGVYRLMSNAREDAGRQMRRGCRS